MTERMTAVIERTEYLGKNPPKHTFNYDLHRFATQKYSTLERWEKIARSVADAIVNQTVYIYPEDRIIGRTFYGEEQKVDCYDPDFYSNSSRAEMLEKHPEYAELCDFHITSWGILGHIAWNWSRVLTMGTSGMRELCLRKLERSKGDEKAEQFYKGVIIMLDALDGWNDLHVKRLEEMGKTEEAEICRRVPKYPARNFKEAVQSFFMQHIVVMKENPFGGNSPGRLDYYLWPYTGKTSQTGIYL